MSKKKKNKLQLFIRKINPASDHNKRIRDKERIIKDEKSTRRQKSVALTQKSAIKRDRDDVKIADIQAKNKADVKRRAERKHADWKRMRKGEMSKEAFIKKYPNSQTAKKAKTSKRKPKKQQGFWEKTFDNV
tara:strand:+ start:29 stop:424 length:396 start_codon:yes stop_codon:yes gene_type:complete